MDKVKKSGRMRYWITYRVNGKQRFEYSGTDFDQAKASDGKRSAQKAEGRLLDIRQTSKITFRKLSDWYYTQEAVLRLKSFRRIKIGIENFNDVFGDTIVSKITHDDLVRYQEKRKKDNVRYGKKKIKIDSKHISQTTIDTEILLVKAMVNMAFLDDKIGGDALKAFIRTKKQVLSGTNARTRTITKAEYAAIIQNAKEHVSDFVTIAMNTGMRKGEIQALRWSHLDADMRFIRLDASETKEKKPKVIPVNQTVRDIIKRQVRWIHHDFIFTWEGDAITSNAGISGSFITAVKKAGIHYGRDTGGMIFHDIRRTVKTLMVRAGIEKAHRDKILGHSPQGMDRHYLIVSDNDLESAMAIYSMFIDGENW